MTLTVTAGSGNYEKAPAGMHSATCVQVIDLGTQASNNPQFKDNVKLMIGWELSGVKDSEGNPVILHQEYSSYLSEKSNLRKITESWRGRPFTSEELKSFHTGKLVGAPCILQIIHQPSKANPERSYAKLTSITPMMNDQPKPITTTPHLVYDLDDPDTNAFSQIDEWIQDKIKSSPEWLATQNQSTQGSGKQQHQPIAEEDIPF